MDRAYTQDIQAVPNITASRLLKYAKFRKMSSSAVSTPALRLQPTVQLAAITTTATATTMTTTTATTTVTNTTAPATLATTSTTAAIWMDILEPAVTVRDIRPRLHRATRNTITRHVSPNINKIMNEEEYKYSVCEIVHQNPLLWDATHRDYKNKDQKTQVWNHIDKKLKPYKAGVTSKSAWENLCKAYNSANQRRKNKPSGSAASDISSWKFASAMSFLTKIRSNRHTTSNLEESVGCGSDHPNDAQSSPDSDGPSIIDQAMNESGISSFGIDDDDDNYDEQDNEDDVIIGDRLMDKKTMQTRCGTNSTTATSKVIINQKSKMLKRKVYDGDHEDEDGLAKALQLRLQEKRESPRMKFLQSILPRVEAMDEDMYLDFQIAVLNLIKDASKPTQSGPHFDVNSTQPIENSSLSRPVTPCPRWLNPSHSVHMPGATIDSYHSSFSPMPSTHFQMRQTMADNM